MPAQLPSRQTPVPQPENTPYRASADAVVTSKIVPPRTPARVPTPPAPPPKVASNEEIDRKIEAVYGVRQEGEIVVFRSRNPEAGEVQVAGDFNDWMPHTTPMRRLPDGDFEARLPLPKGRYRYRLVVDGRWSHDLNNPVTETNEYGELNSIAEVIR